MPPKLVIKPKLRAMQINFTPQLEQYTIKPAFKKPFKSTSSNWYGNPFGSTLKESPFLSFVTKPDVRGT